MTGRNKPVLLVDDDTVRTYTMGEKDRTTRKKIAFKPKHEEKLAYEQAVGGCFPRLTHVGLVHPRIRGREHGFAAMIQSGATWEEYLEYLVKSDLTQGNQAELVMGPRKLPGRG